MTVPTRPILRLLACLAILVALGACGKRSANNVFLVNNDPNLGGPPPGEDGSACVSNRGCDSGHCLTSGQGWDSGYCTTLDCVTNGCNGPDAQCIEFLDESSYCLDACTSNTDCRADYRCRPLDATGRRVCYPDEGDGPGAGQIGAECGTGEDCREGLICDDLQPGGYCLRADCSGTCPGEAVCVTWGSKLRCVQGCSATRDCRVGYRCGEIEGENVCVPSDELTPPFDFSVTEEVLGIQCNGAKGAVEDDGTRWTMSFDIPEGSSSYVVVPFVRTGALRPSSITTPSGRVIDLVGDYIHHNIRVTEFQFFDQEGEGVYGEVAMDWPILVPYAPKHADYVEAGTHTMDLIASTSEPCIYVVAASEPGTVLDLDVYFVGLGGFTAESAPNNGDLRQVFEEVDRLLGKANIAVGEIRYHDAPREISERYPIVRDISEMKRATAFGRPRADTLSGHLSVDMFIVEDLTLGGQALLGLSAGLPGPPGLHGNPANGLIFTGADIGSDNAFVAHIMAHELGHYLGLRHTTESIHQSPQPEWIEFAEVLATTDPIEDTPECSPIGLGYNCPDATNLMFFAAPPQPIDAQITPGQAAVLQANPTIKPAE